MKKLRHSLMNGLAIRNLYLQESKKMLKTKKQMLSQRKLNLISMADGLRKENRNLRSYNSNMRVKDTTTKLDLSMPKSAQQMFHVKNGSHFLLLQTLLSRVKREDKINNVTPLYLTPSLHLLKVKRCRQLTKLILTKHLRAIHRSPQQQDKHLRSVIRMKQSTLVWLDRNYFRLKWIASKVLLEALSLLPQLK